MLYVMPEIPGYSNVVELEQKTLSFLHDKQRKQFPGFTVNINWINHPFWIKQM